MDTAEKDLYVKPYEYNAFADYVCKNHPDYEAWVTSHYIQLCGLDNSVAEQKGFVDYLAGNIFGRISLLNITDYSEEKVDNREHMINVFDCGLRMNHSFYLFLDHYAIKGMEEYGESHNIHDILLVDHTDDEYIYIENVGGKLKKRKLLKSDFVDAYYCHNNSCTFELSANMKARYSFDINVFLTSLDEYLNSLPPKDLQIYFDETDFFSEEFFEGKAKKTCCYGINSFNVAAKALCEAERLGYRADYRMIYILMEHSINLSRKVSYLSKEGYVNEDDAKLLIQELSQVSAAIRLCLYKTIKYDLDLKGGVANDIADKLIWAKNIEYNALLKLTDAINMSKP